MPVIANGAERSTITADDERVVIERRGVFASLRQGGSTTTFMPDVTGVHVDGAGLMRGWIQILIGGEGPTSWSGANQHPRCMYFDRGDEVQVREVADFVSARAHQPQRLADVGIDTAGNILGAPPQGSEPPAHGAKPVILAITSNPRVPDPNVPGGIARPLDLDNELNRMRDALESSPLRDAFDLEQRPAARIDELIGDLLEYPPTILHFSGHGVVGGLIATGPDGLQPILSNPMALAHIVQIPRVRGAIKALVLNACLSAQQAEFLARWVPAVIGTTNTVADDAAIAFTHGFYAGVGNGGSVGECHAAGVAAAALVSPDDAALYVIASATDTASIRFS